MKIIVDCRSLQALLYLPAASASSFPSHADKTLRCAASPLAVAHTALLGTIVVTCITLIAAVNGTLKRTLKGSLEGALKGTLKGTRMGIAKFEESKRV